MRRAVGTAPPVWPPPRAGKFHPMRVLLAGGGSAGHTSPLLATADALRRLDPAVEITCLGTPRGMETTVVPAAGYRLELIPPVPLPRRPNTDLVKVPSLVALGLLIGFARREPQAAAALAARRRRRSAGLAAGRV